VYLKLKTEEKIPGKTKTLKRSYNMNSTLSNKIGTGVMVLLVTVCFIPAIAGAFAPEGGRHDQGFGRKGHHRSILGIWRNPQMIQDLKLTDTQVEQIRDMDFSFREKSLALKAQLDRLRLQMDKAFSEDGVNDATVLKTAQKISDVKGKLFVQRVEARLALVKILDADQIKKLHDMDLRRKGPGPRGKHISRRHRTERPDDKIPFENYKAWRPFCKSGGGAK
jgi:Spy/CpxP family protein refolding chaperone